MFMKYFLIAGEASGDLHAGRLISAIRNKDEKALFAFLGGDYMQKAAGVAPLIHYKDMAYMAFSEVLRHLPQIFANMKKAKAAITSFHPDALILIDYPSFNLKIAKFAHSKGIPVFYYISPKVWAWKEWRVKSLKKYVNTIYSILPFETDFFAHHNLKVEYVGNPTVNEISETLKILPTETEFRSQNKIASDVRIVALLPGSRLGEIRNNLPLMIEAIKKIDGVIPIVAGAPGVDRAFYDSIATDLKIVNDATYALLKYATVAIVTSGTATLETAIVGTPQVVCYRANGSKFAYKLFEKILKVRFVSLPNLIAGKEIVPELLLHFCTPENIATQTLQLLGNTQQRSDMLAGYDLIRKRLSDNDSAGTAADKLVTSLIQSYLNNKIND